LRRCGLHSPWWWRYVRLRCAGRGVCRGLLAS